MLKAITYEEARLKYFQDLARHLERRLEYWCRPSATDRHSWFDVEDNLMEIGAAKSYVEDVIRMLLERSQ